MDFLRGRVSETSSVWMAATTLKSAVELEYESVIYRLVL